MLPVAELHVHIEGTLEPELLDQNGSENKGQQQRKAAPETVPHDPGDHRTGVGAGGCRMRHKILRTCRQRRNNAAPRD